jgi:prepilin-type N-terminal cleavage/methylation domain-containing protein
MTKNSRRIQQGFTLAEVLIAMVIFGILIAIVSGAIVQYMQVQSDQEAVTSAQSKLRRVTELLSQEMRGAVFGSIIATDANPNYNSDEDSISFLLLDGGAGYPVLPLGSGSAFPSAANLQISSSAADTAALGIADNDELLMLNADGDALLFVATNVSKNSGTWRIVHSGGCTNTIDYTPGSFLFKVRTFAVRHDTATNTLFARERNLEQTLAWNISQFRIDYVYEGAGRIEINPLGYPARSVVVGSGTFQLQRLQVVLETTERSRGQNITRTYSSQIEIPNSGQVSIGGLTVCR